MKKIILVLISLLIIVFSCTIIKTCEDTNINLYDLTQKKLINICNYKGKLFTSIVNDYNFNIDQFYEVSKIDEWSIKYIIENINNTNLSII